MVLVHMQLCVLDVLGSDQGTNLQLVVEGTEDRSEHLFIPLLQMLALCGVKVVDTAEEESKGVCWKLRTVRAKQ